jgi:hypothetical protein
MSIAPYTGPAFAQVDPQGSWRRLPRNQDGGGVTGDIARVPVTDAGPRAPMISA